MSPPFDPENAGRLFNNSVSAIRTDSGDVGRYEAEAIEWLKAARYKLMRDLAIAYDTLRKSLDAPMLQPAWAVDPAHELALMTDQLPAALALYHVAIGANLLMLLKASGFEAIEGPRYSTNGYFHFYLTFPAPNMRPQEPRSIHVEDKFSQVERGTSNGAITASDFHRLIDARREFDSDEEVEDDEDD
ncbi:hypothetical protein DFH06DRAFT_1344595 [Mycena polygramma]|nr:hypothetical protein DFH06DRAFT_1344595 [Mycena polygramma]